jgi:hypothetical protein
VRKPAPAYNLITKSYSCARLSAPLQAKDLCLGSLQVRPAHELSLELLPTMFKRAKLPCLGPLETAVPVTHGWCFSGRTTLLFINSETFEFVMVPDVACRGSGLLRQFEEGPSQAVDIGRLYRHVNHILFYEQAGRVCGLVPCLLLGQELEFEVFYYEGDLGQRGPIKQALQQFYAHLLRAFVDGGFLRRDRSLRLTSRRQAELDSLLQQYSRKSVIVQSMRGKYVSVSL